MTTIKLNNSSAFELVSGLWKSDRLPLITGRVLRSTNFNGDGLLDFSDVVELEVEERHIAKRQLKDGDIIIERSGGGPKQPVGRVAFFKAPDEQAYFSSNFTTTLRIRDQNLLDPEFVSLYLHALYLNGDTETLQRATTGIRNLDWQEFLNFEVPKLGLHKQRAIRQLISKVRKAYQCEQSLLTVHRELKQQVMRQLFTCGLRDEAQKDSEIGLIPSRWEVDRLGAHHQIVSGGTPSRSNPAFWTNGTIPWAKTTEVNYCVISQTEEHITPEGLSGSAAKLLPSGTLLLAMYGQGVTRGRVAILGIDAACNQACAAITPKDDAIASKYLYHFLTWRYEAIRELAHGGQQQNLNLDIVRDLKIAYPADPDEQQRIIGILDAIDKKIELHQQKRMHLDEIFRSLLNKMMTGGILDDDLDLSEFTTEEPQPQTEAEVQS
jgi:type I restriction enzyme S subunit